MEYLIKCGYKVIGETEGDGQYRHVFLSRKEDGVWGYLVVEMSEDNEIYDMTALINEKAIRVYL